MQQYLDLAQKILDEGLERKDRTGVGTKGIFGAQMRFDLAEGFPLVTTKKTSLKAITVELLWFLKGDTNIKYLKENGCNIWNQWADENGDLGPVYGKQWRDFNGEGLDQITQLIKNLKENPYSRRHLVSAWNPLVLPDTSVSFSKNIANNKAALPPCHSFFQFYVSSDNKLSCQMYQRSGDLFLGVPYNIASYSILTMMVAQVCGFELGEFVHTLGDVHIYSNHIDQMKLQLTRTPKPLPTLTLNPQKKNIFDFSLDDFTLTNYQADEHIKGEVAV